VNSPGRQGHTKQNVDVVATIILPTNFSGPALQDADERKKGKTLREENSGQMLLVSS